MSTDRRSFLKILGIGATAAVAAPLMSKVQEVNWVGSERGVETDVTPGTYAKFTVDPKGRIAFSDIANNPYRVTKEQVGLGKIPSF